MRSVCPKGVPVIVEKAGIPPENAPALVKYIRDNCPHLEFTGLMTIGSASASRSAQDQQRNPDFEVDTITEVLTQVLLRTREKLMEECPGLDVELSMGMSDDYPVAIKMGSTNVRVGSKIFGQRPPKEQQT
jgi:PLP dependent protein